MANRTNLARKRNQLTSDRAVRTAGVDEVEATEADAAELGGSIPADMRPHPVLVEPEPSSEDAHPRGSVVAAVSLPHGRR